MKSLLFICWDGPQVYYLEGLFLPILKGLQDDYSVHVLQFTWGDEGRSALIKERCTAEGMTYTRYPVKRKPSVTIGTVWTLARGIRFIRRYLEQHAFELVIYRGMFPSFMASRALKQNYVGMKVMDADGLPLDERVDFAGLNPKGLQYKILKDSESRAIRRSDVVLVRTGATIDILAPSSELADKFYVVLNGRDTSFFKPLSAWQRKEMREELELQPSTILLVYGGSLGPQYCVPEMLRLLALLIEKGMDARLLILTGNPEDAGIRDLAPALRDKLIVRSVPFGQMPGYLGAADIGLAIRQPSFSMAGVSPVKLGEYLLCGLPVIASKGIGDTERILNGNGACFLLDDNLEGSLQMAASWVQKLLPGPARAAEARQLGLSHFSLHESILSYKRALKHLQ